MTSHHKYTQIISIFCQNGHGKIYKLNLPCAFAFSEVASVNLQNLGAILGVNLHLKRKEFKRFLAPMSSCEAESIKATGIYYDHQK